MKLRKPSAQGNSCSHRKNAIGSTRLSRSMLPASKQHIAQLSRDRTFLIRTSLGVVAMSVVLAIITSLLIGSKHEPSTELSPEELLRHLGHGTPETSEEWILMIRTGSLFPINPVTSDCRIIVEALTPASTEKAPPEDWKLATDTTPALEPLRLGLRRGEFNAAAEALLALPRDTRYRSEFLGDLYFVQNNYTSAQKAYLDEAERFPNSIYSRRSAVISAWRNQSPPEIRVLLSDPEIRQCFHEAELLNILADARDYRGLAVNILSVSAKSLGSPATTIPFLLSATIWFFILMPFWKISTTRIAVSIGALFAGIISAVLTLYVVMVQERIYGFTDHPNNTPIAQFVFWVAGVGLREETLKLICFIPFGIWAARRQSRVEALVLAGLVGLGFGFAENCFSYQADVTSYNAWGRFLTANALHISLTGILGYYFSKMLMRRFHGWEEFLATFIAVVLAHGIYDAVISMPTLEKYSVLSPILMALIAYRFFDPLRSEMETSGIHLRISPLGVFILGSVALTCITLVTSSALVPLRVSLGIFAASVGSMVPLTFAYISRFRDI